MAESNVFLLRNEKKKAKEGIGGNKYCSSLKKLLKNYPKMKKQVEFYEKQLTVNGLNKNNNGTQLPQIVYCGDKGYHDVYLRSKYIVQLLENAMEELQNFENGEMQCVVIEEMLINNVLRDDIEMVLEERGYPMSRANAYLVLNQALENISVLVWGYDVLKDDATEMLFASQFSDILSGAAA